MTLPKLDSFALPWPVDWGAVFGTERPLILEIGFGLGHFLAFLHQQHPDKNIIGLEINNMCLVKAEKAIVRDGMDNVRVIRSRAETALHHLFPPESLTEVHINFPDPWFKERHSGRRLMQRDTLDAIVSRLIPDGKLYLATDIIAYAEMSAELLADTPGLTNQLDTPWVNTMPGRIVTKYEKKARKAGRTCYYFAYRRNAQPAPNVPLITESPMPHMVMQTPLDLDALANVNVSDYRSETDETRINFMQAYRGERTLLFEIFVHEATIDQHTALVLVEREGQPGEYTLKLSAIGNPRPTDGMHRAVAHLGDALLAMHPESRIIQHKVKS